ncbi:MAG: hypothetical protein IPG08_17660 [Sphingobacteriaceae bacterium]|nr:hypothetical protein [Sphingobacteriaceae bacterium]
MQKLITSAEKETQKAIDIIQRLDEKSWMRGDKGAKKPSELLHINFAFNDGTVKIEHAWLAKEFVEHFKRYYADLHYKIGNSIWQNILIDLRIISKSNSSNIN